MSEHPTPADMLNKAERETAFWREQCDTLAQALQAIADIDTADCVEFVTRADGIACEALARHALLLMDGQ